MALIICPECGKEFSDKATACPNCGAPVEVALAAMNENTSSEDDEEEEEDIQYNGLVRPQQTITCPRCGSSNVLIQREQTASIGARTNKATIQQPKKSHGCLYWIFIGWWYEMFYWMLIGWWKNLFFGHKKKSGLNINAEKTMNRTVGVCQDCGYSWKIK